MAARLKLTDRDVRRALLEQVLADHRTERDTLVVQEFGIDHGACRVDVCVINGSFHGYELKSESDNLLRLPHQIELYGQCLDRSTVVTAPNHLSGVEALLPDWWGIKLALPSEHGAEITDVRPARRNPLQSAFHTARLLWRDEAELLATSIGAPAAVSRANRRSLCSYLADNVPMPYLRRYVREMIKSRGSWRRLESRA